MSIRVKGLVTGAVVTLYQVQYDKYTHDIHARMQWVAVGPWFRTRRDADRAVRTMKASRQWGHLLLRVVEVRAWLSQTYD